MIATKGSGVGVGVMVGVGVGVGRIATSTFSARNRASMEPSMGNAAAALYWNNAFGRSPSVSNCAPYPRYESKSALLPSPPKKFGAPMCNARSVGMA
ncbi:hypothetical protein GC175_01545 [bacterium]|nr:hypothetical protein [bacterium]